jgi:hypothetical protein
MAPSCSLAPSAVSLRGKYRREAGGVLADKIEDRIGKEEFAEWEDKKCRCKICGSPTKQLKTTEGDPEGIRHDRICTNPKCKRKHGMTKAHFFAFHLYPVKGKKPIEAP